MIPSPWLILIFVLAVAGAGISGYRMGHTNGVNDQKVADQGEFDTINKKLADQKTEANAKYRAAQDANLALMTERDRFKTQLEQADVKKRNEINALRTQYAGNSLRFQLKQIDRGCGTSSGSAQATTAVPSGDDATTFVQLPDQIAGNLRQLAYDADQLNADYKTCYDYANQIK